MNEIQKKFGEAEWNNFLSRTQYMDKKTRQQFYDACLFYNTRPGTSWDGGRFGEPFVPYQLSEGYKYGS
jgi:hypothetical protein